MIWLLLVLALFTMADGALAARGKPGLVNRAMATVAQPYQRWAVAGVYLTIAIAYLVASIRMANS